MSVPLSVPASVSYSQLVPARLLRAFALYLFLCLSAVLAGAALAQGPDQPPTLSPAAENDNIALCPQVSIDVVPTAESFGPDALWRRPFPTPTQDGCTHLAVRSGQTVVVRFRLAGGHPPGDQVLQLPITRVDRVELWQRRAGGAGGAAGAGAGGGSPGVWLPAIAGDRVALSRWPFVGQFPAFPLEYQGEPLDVMVAVTNDGSLAVPMRLRTDRTHRDYRLRQSNLTGLTMGLSLMVTVVCALSALTLRRRASWALVVLAAWAFVALIAGNGYMAVWLTPELPEFNDGAKNFVAMVLVGLLAWAICTATDPPGRSRVGERAGMLFALAALSWAAVQWALLPAAWRTPTAAVWAAAGWLLSAALCVRAWMRRRSAGPWIHAALLLQLVVIAFALMPADLTWGLDLRSTGGAFMLMVCLMLHRHGLGVRERHGRAVLSRATAGDQRDPLTALLSWRGFESAVERQGLLHQAGACNRVVVLVLLPAMDEGERQHGFEATERTLVRLATLMYSAFGGQWELARISKSRFAAVGMEGATAADAHAAATALLARLARQPLVPDPIADMDMRVAVRELPGGPLRTEQLGEELRELESIARGLGRGKRIAMP